MAVVKIIELVGSSSESSDAAVQAALSDAQQTLRNIKAVDVVSTGLRGDNLDRVARARARGVPDRPRQRVGRGWRRAPAGRPPLPGPRLGSPRANSVTSA